MTTRGLLVDFENVQKMNLSGLSEDFHVTVFVGSSQKSLPFELVQGSQRLGTRLEWIRVEGNGNNALDFHIAYFLGCCFTRHPNAHYFLSKDSGFDPLVRYLNRNGFHCRRINSLLELAPRENVETDANYRRVLEILAKGDKRARPRKRTTLAQHIATMFQKKLPEEEVERLMDLLFVEGIVRETNQALTYTL